MEDIFIINACNLLYKITKIIPKDDFFLSKFYEDDIFESTFLYKIETHNFNQTILKYE